MTAMKTTNALAERDEDSAFIAELEKRLMQLDDTTARAHLDAGFPIYYMEESTPEHLIVKEYPSGRRQWIRLVNDQEQVVKEL